MLGVHHDIASVYTVRHTVQCRCWLTCFYSRHWSDWTVSVPWEGGVATGALLHESGLMAHVAFMDIRCSVQAAWEWQEVKYGTRNCKVTWWVFTPQVLSTLGGMAHESTVFYKGLADRLSSQLMLDKLLFSHGQVEMKNFLHTAEIHDHTPMDVPWCPGETASFNTLITNSHNVHS